MSPDELPDIGLELVVSHACQLEGLGSSWKRPDMSSTPSTGTDSLLDTTGYGSQAFRIRKTTINQLELVARQHTSATCTSITLVG